MDVGDRPRGRQLGAVALEVALLHRGEATHHVDQAGDADRVGGGGRTEVAGEVVDQRDVRRG